MLRFSLLGSLATALLAIVAVPALANTAPWAISPPRAATARPLLADESSPAGMQERSRRSDFDRDEASPDNADSADESENDDDRDGGAFADRRDYGAPDEDDGPDDRGYDSGSGSSADGDGPPPGYEDGDHAAPADEDDQDDETDDDSGNYLA
jgi:hypothetical protein